MSGLAAVHKTQETAGDEAIYGWPDGTGAEVNAASEPVHRKAEAGLAFETAVAQEMPVNDAVGHGEAEARDGMIFDLLPEEFSIGFFGFHDLILKVKLRVESGLPEGNGT